MTASALSAEPLLGRYVRLDPITESDLPALYRAIARSEVFAGGYGGGPAGLPADEGAFARFAHSYYSWNGDGITWVVRIAGDSPAAGTVVGTSTLGDVDLVNEAIHLGWTAYAPEVWGTPVNPECKLLLLGRAFVHGFGRVKLQADARNERSRAAIAKLGARFEGVLRRHKARADGSWRDTAVYSVIIDEWPELRAGLEARIAAWHDGTLIVPPRSGR